MSRCLVVLALMAAATSASAQTYGRLPPPPLATLYAQTGFQGQQLSVTAVNNDLGKSGFNDLAQSARFQGKWRICKDSGFGSKCQDVEGDVPDLAAIGLGSTISSLQAYVPNFQTRGPAWGWNGDGWQGQPMAGARHVLFPFPSLYGFDIASNGNSASAFCASQNLSSSDYSDTSTTAPQALDGQGRYFSNTSVLRDVLCRK